MTDTNRVIDYCRRCHKQTLWRCIRQCWGYLWVCSGCEQTMEQLYDEFEDHGYE